MGLKRVAVMVHEMVESLGDEMADGMDVSWVALTVAIMVQKKVGVKDFRMVIRWVGDLAAWME